MRTDWRNSHQHGHSAGCRDRVGDSLAGRVSRLDKITRICPHRLRHADLKHAHVSTCLYKQAIRLAEPREKPASSSHCPPYQPAKVRTAGRLKGLPRMDESHIWAYNVVDDGPRTPLRPGHDNEHAFIAPLPHARRAWAILCAVSSNSACLRDERFACSMSIAVAPRSNRLGPATCRSRQGGQ